MLNTCLLGSRFCKMASGVAFLALLASCNSSKAKEETFSLYIDMNSYNELVSTLQTYSSRHKYHIVLEDLTGRNAETTAHHVMIEGNGVRILVQNALAEQCVEREGRRDVEYSQKVFDVNAFSTSYFQSSSDLSEQVNRLKSALTSSGFRVVSRSESCNLL